MTVVRIVGTLKPFAAFAKPITLFRIMDGSWLWRFANWKGWWSINTTTLFCGVRRASRPIFLVDDVMVFCLSIDVSNNNSGYCVWGPIVQNIPLAFARG